MTTDQITAVLTILFTFSLVNVGVVEILKGLKFHPVSIPFISMGTGVLTVYLFTKSLDGPGIAMGIIVGLLSSGGYTAFAKVRDTILRARGLKTGDDVK